MTEYFINFAGGPTPPQIDIEPATLLTLALIMLAGLAANAITDAIKQHLPLFVNKKLKGKGNPPKQQLKNRHTHTLTLPKHDMLAYEIVRDLPTPEMKIEGTMAELVTAIVSIAIGSVLAYLGTWFEGLDQSWQLIIVASSWPMAKIYFEIKKIREL